MAIKRIAIWLAAAIVLNPAHAQSNWTFDALQEGPYITASGIAVSPENKDAPRLADGIGGSLGVGHRFGWYGMEITGSTVDLTGATLNTVALSGLLFPLQSLPAAYLLAGVSGSQYKDFQTSTGSIEFSTTNVEAGLGAWWPVSWGAYRYGLRGELRHRWGRREQDYNDLDVDLDAPRSFDGWVLSIGFQLPMEASIRTAGPAPDEPIQVVAVEKTPAVPAPEPTPLPAVEEIAAAEPIPAAEAGCAEGSLEGCGRGDEIVLRGVNFETGSAHLTGNAETVLDTVAEELRRYPALVIEIGGHTDAVGSEADNASLSDRRAASVLRYLESRSVEVGRMSSKGYGELQPVAGNGTVQGRAENRRVQIKIVSGDSEEQ